MRCCDASLMSVDSVLLQDGKFVAHALRQLRIHKRIYTIRDLELVVVILCWNIWRYYFYGFEFEVFRNRMNIKYLFGLRE